MDTEHTAITVDFRKGTEGAGGAGARDHDRRPVLRTGLRVPGQAGGPDQANRRRDGRRRCRISLCPTTTAFRWRGSEVALESDPTPLNQTRRLLFGGHDLAR